MNLNIFCWAEGELEQVDSTLGFPFLKLRGFLPLFGLSGGLG